MTECGTLRIQDIDFASPIVSDRDGKCEKDLTTALLRGLKSDLLAQDEKKPRLAGLFLLHLGGDRWI
ncbi:MAG: hypothetical protein R8K20_09460 [Gallionellaceae bacterium]